MEAIGTRRLDFSKLKFKEETTSSKEALKDVIPFNFSKEVESGIKTVVVDVKKKK